MECLDEDSIFPVSRLSRKDFIQLAKDLGYRVSDKYSVKVNIKILN
jgi:hypothetical protein